MITDKATNTVSVSPQMYPNKKAVIFGLALLIALIFLLANSQSAFCENKKHLVRSPAVAGAFYPATAEETRRLVKKYLDAVPELPKITDPRILIQPHAGYIYSGPFAAYGFKLIEGMQFDTVILIGPSHYTRFPGVSVYPRGSYDTPLGRVSIDEDIASKLIQSDDRIFFYKPAHIREHSLEVQVPFLQVVLKGFKIVPILIGTDDYRTSEILADSIKEAITGKNVLILISTDLSHYYAYDKAKVLDKNTINDILRLDPKRLYKDFGMGKAEACGHAPAVTALILARLEGWEKAALLKSGNSGDTAGDKYRVVGYASIVIYGGEEKNMNPADKQEKVVSEEGKRKLLEIARSTLSEVLAGRKRPSFKIEEEDLNQKLGAFVTLREHGKLRGCIGNFISDKPLYETVQSMAVAAALEDPRFPPVKAGELQGVNIEISVLSPMRRVQSADEIELGKHGVYLKKGLRGGTFLPQVATETGWNKEEFLGHLARDKAGLSWDGWKDAELYVYTADVFGEGEK